MKIVARITDPDGTVTEMSAEAWQLWVTAIVGAKVDGEFELEIDKEPCGHPRTYADGPRKGECTVCHQQLENVSPIRKPVGEFGPIEVPLRHLGVLRQLTNEGNRERLPNGMMARFIAANLGFTVARVSSSLNYLQQHGLAERVTGTWNWVSTPIARNHQAIPA
jgi:hypothetical protein